MEYKYNKLKKDYNGIQEDGPDPEYKKVTRVFDSESSDSEPEHH
jgi:hypothetical protein